MKKLLVLTAALALFAAPAFATIINGPHDLSDNNVQTGTTEVCVYCHTPHSALSNAFTDVPLWNIKASANTSSVTGESAMCMACHDGQVLFADQSNPTNSAAAGGGYNFTTYGAIAADAAGLSNDHPVGINYADSITSKPGEFKAIGSLTGGVKLSTANRVECFSCHDVHNETNTPFLISTNAGSALCVGCHNK